ncbi:hypothetical protein F4826_001108 [Rahnella inusitata]|nr:hypothetical protein [Rahnella inusitata]
MAGDEQCVDNGLPFAFHIESTQLWVKLNCPADRVKREPDHLKAQQRGDFAEAAKLWASANALAHGKKVCWSDERVDFCRKAEKRAKVVAGELFQYERAS